jgi:hypothetical protein
MVTLGWVWLITIRLREVSVSMFCTPFQEFPLGTGNVLAAGAVVTVP